MYRVFRFLTQCSHPLPKPSQGHGGPGTGSTSPPLPPARLTRPLYALPSHSINPDFLSDHISAIKGPSIANIYFAASFSMYRTGGSLLSVAKGPSSLIFMRQFVPKVMAIPCQKAPRKRHPIGSQHPPRTALHAAGSLAPSNSSFGVFKPIFGSKLHRIHTPQGKPLSITVTFLKELSHGQLLPVCIPML